jgi:hypothetical protein
MSLPDQIFDDWPEPRPLDPELPAVPEIDTASLPGPIAAVVGDVSDLMQVSPDLAAIPAIGAIAGCIGRRAEVRPKRNDWTWREPINLWGAIVAPPGFLKSPVLRLMTQPLENIQRDWADMDEVEQSHYEELKALAEIEEKQWKAKAAAAMAKGQPPPPRPETDVWKPGGRRITVTDSTPEKLHELLESNPAGVLMIRDELAGWLADLEKPGRESERKFWMTVWNGKGAYFIDRILRGTVVVPNLCLSMLGAIVPDGIRFYFSGLLDGRIGANDGLLQRVQLLSWPDMQRDWKWVDRLPNKTAMDKYESICRALTNLSGRFPLTMTFNESARERFIEWVTTLEQRVRSGELGPFLTSHLAKYRGFLPRLAGLFQLVEMASKGDLDNLSAPTEEFAAMPTAHRHIVLEPPPPPEPSDATLIDLGNIECAIELCSYFEAHAQRVYSCVTTQEMASAHELARHLEKGDVASPFTVRDIYRKGWTLLKEDSQVATALSVLEDAHWVRRIDPEPALKVTGRPSTRWMAHPRFCGPGSTTW